MGLFDPLGKYDAARWISGGPPPRTKHANNGREYREEDHHGDHIVDVLADVGDEMAKRIPTEDRGANPEDASKSVEEQVTRIGHSCGACDRRTERSDDGNEARENYGPASVFFVKIVGALEMAAAEKQGIFAAVEGSACGTANPIADLITCDSAEHDRQEKPLERNDSRVGEDACGDEKRVTGKKKADKETGFDKDDGADERSASRAD
jgi:hypothetical protein